MIFINIFYDDGCEFETERSRNFVLQEQIEWEDLIREMDEKLRIAFGDGPYSDWRLTESAEKQGIDKRAAYESISAHQMTLGHAANAIRGEQFDTAKQSLLKLREAVDASLEALGEGKPLTGAS